MLTFRKYSAYFCLQICNNFTILRHMYVVHAMQCLFSLMSKCMWYMYRQVEKLMLWKQRSDDRKTSCWNSKSVFLPHLGWVWQWVQYLRLYVFDIKQEWKVQRDSKIFNYSKHLQSYFGEHKKQDWKGSIKKY